MEKVEGEDESGRGTTGMHPGSKQSAKSNQNIPLFGFGISLILRGWTHFFLFINGQKEKM